MMNCTLNKSVRGFGGLLHTWYRGLAKQRSRVVQIAFELSLTVESCLLTWVEHRVLVVVFSIAVRICLRALGFLFR